MTKIVFEKQACSRCGGSGRMPFSVYGGVCFKCNGKGEMLTRRGAAAFKKVQEVRKQVCTVPASSVKPGMRIVGSDGKARTVVSVETRLGKGNGVGRSGVEGTDSFCEVWTYGETLIRTKKNGYSGAAHRSVTLAWTAETLAVAAEAVRRMKGATVIEEAVAS